MSKKRRYKKEEPKGDSLQTYEEAVRKFPQLEGVILPSAHRMVGATHTNTLGMFEGFWLGNMKTNIENGLWKRFGMARNSCQGLGENKAIIAVGAGQSFNLNKHVLKNIVDYDGWQNWADRNFIVIASNHQFKPLLKMGIIPDFVMLSDGGDIALPQLTEDIPPEGQNTTLIAGLHCSPKVLEAWAKQGRLIRFVLASSQEFRNKYKEFTGKNPIPYMLFHGGNVLNSMIALSLLIFDSKVFMAVGNDLSYEIKDKLQDQRDSYYADGDYSSNQPKIGSGRDEAKANRRWMGFKLKRKLIYTGTDRYDTELDMVGTSPTLWTYKTWLESNLIMNYYEPKAPKMIYYNCSEAGILGVMARKTQAELGDKFLELDNWFMLDEECPHFHTSMLADAAKHFLIAKEATKWQRTILPDALGVIGLERNQRPDLLDFANPVQQNRFVSNVGNLHINI